MKKKVNKYFKKIAKENSISENTEFGRYFYLKSKELSDIGVDNSFKLEMLKKADLEKDSDSIEKLAFNYFSFDNKTKNEDNCLAKWKNIYYLIKSKASNKYSAQYLAEKYSNDLDKEEAFRFLNWFKYYSNGEHIKYSGDKMRIIKKKSNFNFGTSPNGPYPKPPKIDERDFESLTYLDEVKKNLKGKKTPEEHLEDINLAYDHDDIDEKPPSLSEEDNESIFKFKKSISRGVKSILSNMMNSHSLDSESVKRVMKSLNDLTFEAHRLTNASTASSVIYKTANKLKRDGITFGIDELNKLAQEVEAQSAEAPVAPQPVEQAPIEQMPAEQATAEEVDPKNSIPKSDEVQPARFEDIETEGPEEGEYDKIIDDSIDIHDASEKLDQVASMLADRRVIRNLAEFDIMLDKLGIASMFPELAESQSKLIDAFGYALTRVTKMMGQLSNAQTIMGQSDAIPGSEEE